MKFFTQALLERFASKDDDIALSAQDELEVRSDQYRTHWQEIKSKLPHRFRVMQDSYYLHDAKILSSSPLSIHSPFTGASSLCRSLLLVLQLDTPPHPVLVLHYQDLEKLIWEQVSWKEPHSFLEWQYDEVFIEKEQDKPTFCHFIAISNGTEISVHFQDFDFAILDTQASKVITPL